MGDGVAKVARRLQEAKETGKLDLSSCDLTHVPDAAYFLMKNVTIEACDLSNNALKRIPSKFTTKFPNLKELDLRANRLSSLPEEFHSLGDINMLDLSENNFEGLPAFVYENSNLKRLYARDNKITDVDIDKLRRMLALTQVDLQDNPLTSETQDKLKAIDVFTVQIGESDPEGKQLNTVE